MAAHVHFPIRQFAAGHPYAADWFLVTAAALAALLLWFWNS